MKWFLLLLGLLLVPSVWASATSNYYAPNEERLIFGACLDSNNNFINTNATITIYNTDAVVIINANMSVFSTGQFYYNLTVPNTTGIYAYNILCASGGTGQSTFEVISIEEEINRMMALIALLTLVTAIFIISVSYKSNNMLLQILAGLLLVVTAWPIGYNLTGNEFGMFIFFAVGVYFIIVAGLTFKTND